MEAIKQPKLPRKYQLHCKLDDSHIDYMRRLYKMGLGYTLIKKDFDKKFFVVSRTTIARWCKTDEERKKYLKYRYQVRKKSGYKYKYDPLNAKDRYERKKKLFPEAMTEWMRKKDRAAFERNPERYKQRHYQSFLRFIKRNPNYMKEYFKSYKSNQS